MLLNQPRLGHIILYNRKKKSLIDISKRLPLVGFLCDDQRKIRSCVKTALIMTRCFFYESKDENDTSVRGSWLLQNVSRMFRNFKMLCNLLNYTKIKGKGNERRLEKNLEVIKCNKFY